MGAVDCPICETTRHIDDQGQKDCCWACGWIIPVNPGGEYRPKSEWPTIGEQERRDRKRHAEKVLASRGER